jgi:Holliday junction DNA helicase RuvA
MISRIRGKLKQINDNNILLDVNGICYRILLARAIMDKLPAGIKDDDSELELVTLHYLQTEQNKSFPILIGFFNEIEREFFEKLISVSSIGPKIALKALELPISQIAQAIDDGNISLLASLPGISHQRAKEIVAKLQGKVGKYGLIKDGVRRKSPETVLNLREEAMEVLTQLQYSRREAEAMIKEVLSRCPEVVTVEELLNEVYRRKKQIR